MIQGSNVKEAVVDQEKDEDVADHRTETDEGTETDEADHEKEQKTVEETEVDLEKEEGLQHHNFKL